MIRRSLPGLALVASLICCSVTGASALAAVPLEHTTGEPANVTPYPASTPVKPALRAQSATTGVGPQPCTGAGTITAAQSYYGFGYLANQIAQAYGLDSFYANGDEGQGQTIALLELEPNKATDIDTYQGCYGTHATVNYIAVDGGLNGDGTTDTTDPGEGEAALDIEQIIGLAPQATIDVYQAPNSEAGVLAAYQAMVSNPSVTIISTSWGACETGNPLASLEEPIFQTAEQDGITVFAAAGDNGSTDCGTSSPAVDDPASDPYVTGVGGTTLPNLASLSQQFAWNGSSIGDGASGGGFSALWDEPSWQQAATVQSQSAAASSSQLSCPDAIGGGYCRAVPDVSADADPYTGYIIYLTQNVTDPSTGTTSPELTAVPWGGTSAAAPLWAAMTALINASPDCGGQNLGFINPLLYQVGVKGMPGLTDITSGNNNDTALSPNFYFSAGHGYDPVTGLGTPSGYQLAQSLCAQADTLTLSTPSSEASTYGQSVDVTGVNGTDAQGHTLTYSATGLPAGLSINASTGAIAGTPTANANATVRVTVTAADNGATKTSIVPWTVTGAPTTTTSTTPPPTSTGESSGGQQQSGGGAISTPAPKPRVVQLTRRYHGHLIHMALTISGSTGHQSLLVSYTDKAGRSVSRLKLVKLGVRPLAHAGRSLAHETGRLTVLRTVRKTSGQISVSLTATRIARGLDVELDYRSGGQLLIVLPHL
jgi:kumamolisin